MSIFHKFSTIIGPLIPDKLYIQIRYFFYFKKFCNLSQPETFNEKIQWLKLYNRKPIYTVMVDKYAVKEYVANLIGEEHIIPTIGVWDSFDEIDFNKLPPQFVLKCTHDSGSMALCKDKSVFDIPKARKMLQKSLKTNYYLRAREWPYLNVPHRIIAEKYMEDESGELKDYKFFCFDGEVKALYIATERNSKTETKFDFFDTDFNHLPFTQTHPNSDKIIEKPKCFEQMKHLASILSRGIPHVRVDFYEVNEKVYFGELTFSHMSGCHRFEPSEWDKHFGDWITLPNK